jgi:hypothetical protein
VAAYRDGVAVVVEFTGGTQTAAFEPVEQLAALGPEFGSPVERALAPGQQRFVADVRTFPTHGNACSMLSVGPPTMVVRTPG